MLLRFIFAAWLIFAASSQALASHRIVVFGDSLSAAYNMPLEAGWVALLETRLLAFGCDADVVNAAISGETSSGGLTRLPDVLERYQPTLVILELGANDGLRGLSLKALEGNLRQMIEMSTDAGADVALLGIRIPTNYGRRYGEQLAGLYPKLAEEYELAVSPFFIADVALKPDLMLPDRIHPNEDAQPILMEEVLRVIEPLVGGCNPPG